MRHPNRQRKSRGIHNAALRLALALSPIAVAGCATPPSGVGDYLALSPHWNYKTLETEHFRLTFPEELEDIARQSGAALEEAHRILSPALRWDPTQRPGPTASKTQVLVIDNVDSANGLTSATGRFGMVFYAKPPENWTSIYSYDDWLKLLAIHEYTHYLNLDPTTGYASWLRFLLGDLYLPNSLWPSWMLEGLAVYMETRHTGAGRGRSSFYEMILRAAVSEGVLDRPEFITLDRINGPNPYYPLGETAYLFGYNLMNRIASEPYRDQPRGDAALGDMSFRSAGRIPYLINSNLENITGKTWYRYWAEWVEDTTKRGNAQIEAIRARGETRYELLTRTGRQTLGSAFSPDGRWLAYSQSTDDETMAVFLRDLSTGRTMRLERKSQGATMAFTPDSRTLVFSALRRVDNYNLTSELLAYDLERGELRQLSRGWRASDPDVSSDGTKVVFKQSDRGLEFISISDIERDEDGRLRLGIPRRVYTPGARDAVATPRFATKSSDRIVFTQHRNGRASEELMELVISASAGTARTLVENGGFNRFPVVHPTTGDIYFVSDLGGVNNLHLLRASTPSGYAKKSEAITNLVTGMMLPSIDTQGRIYGAIFATRGWNLAKLEIPASPQAIQLAQITAPPAPPRSAESQEPESELAKAALTAPTADYSIWPSILPRQWSPLLYWGSANSLAVGGEILGFDTADRHRYFGAVLYDLDTRLPDWSLMYANRSLGPTLTFSGAQTTAIGAYDFNLGAPVNYTRKSTYYISLSQSIRSTHWAMTPFISLNTSQSMLIAPGSNPGGSDVVAQERFIPSVDAGFSYASTFSSDLAITAEEGRSYAFGLRTYPIGFGTPVYKLFAKANEYFPLGAHHVLLGTLKGQAVSRIPDITSVAVNTRGRGAASTLQTLPSDSLDQLAIRGYPNLLYYSKSTAIGSLDWRFPLAPIFRGWGTQPLFLSHLFGFAFGEASYFPDGEPGAKLLPSAGAGLRLSTELFNQIPLVFSAEYHHGFAVAAGGRGEFFFQMGFSNFGF